jgi:hypothetical protein
MYGWETELAALAALDDQAAADAINAMTETKLIPGSMITSRSLPLLFTNPLDGERLNRKFDAIAAWTIPTGDTDNDIFVSLAIRSIRDWLRPESGGIDAGNQAVRSLIDLLPSVPNSNVTEAEVAVLKTVGIKTVQKYPWTAAGEIKTARSQM